MSEARKAKFFALMRRFNELACLLPAPGDLDTDDVAAVAEAQLVIAEINRTNPRWMRCSIWRAAARQKASAS